MAFSIKIIPLLGSLRIQTVLCSVCRLSVLLAQALHGLTGIIAQLLAELRAFFCLVEVGGCAYEG